MHSPIKRKFKAVQVASLPVGPIGRALELDLDAAPLLFSRGAQKHAHDRHAEDFDLCLANFERLVSNPLYAGDDVKNPGKFEIVSRLQVENVPVHMLIAITLEIQADGCYHVTSCYRLNEAIVTNRREKDRLRVVVYT